jgi:hypothetical protein
MPLRLVFVSTPKFSASARPGPPRATARPRQSSPHIPKAGGGGQLPPPKLNGSRMLRRKPPLCLVAAPFIRFGRAARLGSWELVVGICLACAFLPSTPTSSQGTRARRVTWEDIRPVQTRLGAVGVNGTAFSEYVARTHAENLRRVREGELDHLIFYLLQSTHFTALPAIEPAVSARTLVESLDAPQRSAFLKTSELDAAKVPAAVRARIAAFTLALDRPGADVRLTYFNDLVAEAVPKSADVKSALASEYLRAMRFVYEKEFVAQKAAHPADAVADLYRTRGLSTDTAIEAGYLVHLGLAVAKGLRPDRRIRRVLIVGPGMDLAPRTGFREVPPESYQPWAVIDTLVSTGFAVLDDLEVTAADINPRVVSHLRRSAASPPTLHLTTGIAARNGVSFSRDYREYFDGLGARLTMPARAAAVSETGGHLRKSVQVSTAAAKVLRAEPLDIVTERLTESPFDLVIATNILPYFGDQQLALAVSNIAAMLAPGGLFLHNEARPILGELAAAFGLPFEQSRHAVLATVTGAPAPLFDSVFLHVRR